MATYATDPTTTVLSGIAAHQCARFAGHNLRIRRSPVVHAVRMYPWVSGLELPGPACGQGWSGVGLSGELHAVTDPVTCHHCLHSERARAAARAVGVPTGRQLALDFEPDAPAPDAPAPDGPAPDAPAPDGPASDAGTETACESLALLRRAVRLPGRMRARARGRRPAAPRGGHRGPEGRRP